jgi:chromosome partitioning protein
LRNEVGQQDYTTVALYGTSLLLQGQLLAPNYEEVLIDVGGRDSGSLRAALTLSDRVIIPNAPRTFDVWAMEFLQTLVNEAKSVNPKLQAHSFINLGEVRGSENQDAIEVLREFESLPTLVSIIMRRKVYAESLAQGKGVFEMKNEKAKSEMNSLLSEVYRLTIS